MASCTRCGTANHGEGNIFAFCDGCNAGWHLTCARHFTPLAEDAEWIGPCCIRGQTAPTATGRREVRSTPMRTETRPRFATTFKSAPRPILDKTLMRQAVGLVEGAPVNLEMARRVLDNGLATSSLRKREIEVLEFERVRQENGLGYDHDALDVFAVSALQRGLASSTINQKVGVVKAALPFIDVPEHRAKRLRQAIDRFGNVSSGAKKPITPHEVQLIMDAASSQQFSEAMDAATKERIVRRDRAFFALAFAAVPRGAELAALEFEHVRAVWAPPGGALTALRLGEPAPPGWTMIGLRLHIIQSKTDQAGVGRAAEVELSDQPQSERCPARLLLQLYQHRREGQLFVFAEQREHLRPGPISAGTFRSKLRRFASTCMPQERVEELSLHSFRKGGVTAARKAGATVEQTRTAGGWSAKTTTNFDYTWVDDEDAFAFSNKTVKAIVGE